VRESRTCPSRAAKAPSEISTTNADLIGLLRRDAWFGSLPPRLAEIILQQSVMRNFPDGARIYTAGDAPSGIYGVVHGSVRMTHHAATGDYSIYYVNQPPVWFGELSEFDGEPRMQDATANGDVSLFHLPHHAFHRIINVEPRYCFDFARLMAAHMRAVFQTLAQVNTLTVASRVAQTLLRMQNVSAGLGRENDVPRLSQDALAAIIGVSRQTINKLVRQWERNGIVEIRYRKIWIVDQAALHRLASE
jgi:CRP/FNR family cyclic AMP-dependent transcriptional regulator